MKEIPLYCKKDVVAYTKVSDEDYDRLVQWRWGISKRPRVSYAQRTIRINGKVTTMLMHRVIMEYIIGEKLNNAKLVDHKDHNGLNNKRDNIRVSTYSENQMNQRAKNNSSSGVKGVSWHKRDKKWISQIKLNNKLIYLGYFNTKEEAYRVYCDNAKKLFGEFCCNG